MGDGSTVDHLTNFRWRKLARDRQARKLENYILCVTHRRLCFQGMTMVSFWCLGVSKLKTRVIIVLILQLTFIPRFLVSLPK
jgi:hypothetical protein